jgi:hypothetical protein
MYMTYDPNLIARCHYFWEASQYQVIPDIRAVAAMDMNYIDDLMTYDQVVAWIKGKNKRMSG